MKTRKEYILDEWRYFRQETKGMWRGESLTTSFIAGLYFLVIFALGWALGFFLAATGFYRWQDLEKKRSK